MGQYVDNGMGGSPVWVPSGPGDNPPASGPANNNPTVKGPGDHYQDTHGRYILGPDGEAIWQDDSEDTSHQVADLTATLLRNQFEDWQKLFMPIELNAINQLSFNNPSVLSDAVGKAGGAAELQSNTMTGINQRQNRALGIQPTAQQSQTTKRLMDLNKAQNIAGAEDLARANVRVQDELILLGSAPNPQIAKGGIQA